jgi:hypothetical protein
LKKSTTKKSPRRAKSPTRINPSEAITFFRQNPLIAGAFVTAIFDETNLPIPAMLVDPLNDDLTNFVLMLDGDGMINRNLMFAVDDIVNGKKVRMRHS